ncbi:hypothetical protein MACK_000886 [Theileria orientalis]|uniref:Uncharacterized protein n=1 Tax=Theileria orientalis TaxID=68886 RepID=A0A976MAQ8_THEOR|nr:hypothetical protein MACK_000886 [Theileria orientalis]
MTETHIVKKNTRHTDIQLCSMVCGRSVDGIIEILGTYCCQALFINALFLILSNIAQWIQKEFNVDTSSFFSAKFYGLLTVTFGSYISYKVSELLVDAFLKVFKDSFLAGRMREVMNPSKSSLACINVPILLLYRCSKYLHNQLPLNLGSLDIHIKNQLLGSDDAKDDVNEDVRISVKSPRPNRGRFKRELAVISGYGLGTFLLLGGSLHSFTPSELSHPGAYAMPKLSLKADGYGYANSFQKRIIQTIGKKYGCHTCGMISDKEKYIADHQPPSGVVKRKLSGKYISFLLRHRLIPIHLVKPEQHFYPQCNKCSIKQAAAVSKNRRESVTHFGRFRTYHLCPTTFFVSRVIFDTKWSKLNRKVK